MPVVLPNYAPFSIELFYTVDDFQHSMTWQTDVATLVDPLLEGPQWSFALNGGAFLPVLTYVSAICTVLASSMFSEQAHIDYYDLIDNQEGAPAGVVKTSEALDFDGAAGATYEKAGQFTLAYKAQTNQTYRIVLLETASETPVRFAASSNPGWTALYDAFKADTDRATSILFGRNGNPAGISRNVTGSLNKKLRRIRHLV